MALWDRQYTVPANYRQPRVSSPQTKLPRSSKANDWSATASCYDAQVRVLKLASCRRFSSLGRFPLQDPPPGISPKAAAVVIAEVLESIGDACPECPPD
jgi:hypothetical protein